jgi:hypothetical protein
MPVEGYVIEANMGDSALVHYVESNFNFFKDTDISLGANSKSKVSRS